MYFIEYSSLWMVYDLIFYIPQGFYSKQQLVISFILSHDIVFVFYLLGYSW